jgi:hypothetical protein
MFRKILELRLPHRVAGVFVFVATADPVAEMVTRFSFEHFHSEVTTKQTKSLGDEAVDAIQAIPLNQRMSFATIGVDHEAICRIKDGIILGVSIQ